MRRQVSTKGQGKQRFKFVGETVAELRKVVWPTRQEATYLTTIVIVVTVAVAMTLWVVDLGFSELMNVILLR
ncbi:MAG: preprotein translocase subunit SecE [Dehalococcoidia bacterium]|nr:preprotein translocase subunit SecE [Dehalococcoidia bacterium]